MTELKCFDEFYDHLTHSIRSGKDVYIFGYTCDDNDFYFDEENKSTCDYYITHMIDFSRLQFIIDRDFNGEYNMNLAIIMDWVNDDDFIYRRIHIFECD